MESIILDSDSVTLVSAGSQGPAGPPGTGVDVSISKVAGETMSAYRAVVADGDTNILLADNATMSHRARVLGVIEQAVNFGTTVSVKCQGEIAFVNWNWTVDLPIFLGAVGQLTQVAPVTPAVFSIIIGVAVSATRIEVGIRNYVLIS